MYKLICMPRLLGVNPRILPKVNLTNDFLPRPFIASQSDSTIKNNVQIALDLLDVQPCCRDYIVVCDETAWCPMLDLVTGLKPENQQEMVYIGGFFSPIPEESKALMTLEGMKESTDEDLSRLSQHYIVSRANTNHQTFCVDLLPRAPKASGIESASSSALNTFKEMGKLLWNASTAHGAPPISIAFDAGTAHSILNRSLMGLVSPETLQQAKFFDKCSIKQVELPCFNFGVLIHQNKDVLLGCLDLRHVLKRYAFHLATASRFLE